MQPVIYEPRGRAREYSPLACNLYLGCSHGCKYCYAPKVMCSTLARWSAEIRPRKAILASLERDAQLLKGDRRDILFSFLSDPYQPANDKHKLTRYALQVVGKYNLKAQVLTKGGMRAVADFDLFKKHGFKFGTTLIFLKESLREEWEPGAAPVDDRIKALMEAHRQGIYTWVSVEPVVDPEQALAVIEKLHKAVDFWKIGKLNYHAKASTIDWHRFYLDVRTLVRRLKVKAYIKKDLLAFAQGGL